MHPWIGEDKIFRIEKLEFLVEFILTSIWLLYFLIQNQIKSIENFSPIYTAAIRLWEVGVNV